MLGVDLLAQELLDRRPRVARMNATGSAQAAAAPQGLPLEPASASVVGVASGAAGLMVASAVTEAGVHWVDVVGAARVGVGRGTIGP